MKILCFLAMAIFLLPYSLKAQTQETCEIEFKDRKLCAEINWTRGPLWGGFSKAMVTYHHPKSKERKIDPPKELTPYIWMVMEKVEHGGRTPLVKRREKGVYEFDQLQFLKMSDGQWQLRWRPEKSDEKTGHIALYDIPLKD